MAEYEIEFEMETDLEDEREVQRLREDALASRVSQSEGMSRGLLDGFNYLRARLRQPPPTAEAATPALLHQSASASVLEEERIA